MIDEKKTSSDFHITLLVIGVAIALMLAASWLLENHLSGFSFNWWNATSQSCRDCVSQYYNISNTSISQVNQSIKELCNCTLELRNGY